MKPQDILILLKVFLESDKDWTQARIAESLGMSASEVNHGLKHLEAAKLYDPADRSVRRFALLDLLTYAIKHVFLATLGPVKRGVPTSHAGPALAKELVFDPEDLYVWPDPKGKARGRSLAPLYRSAPTAARNEERLYELLTLIDALRIGQAREVGLAKKMLKDRLVGSEAA